MVKNPGKDKLHLPLSARVYHEATNLLPSSGSLSATAGLPSVLFNMNNWQNVDTVTGVSSHTSRYKDLEDKPHLPLNAKVYHKATNLLPPSPPTTPTETVYTFQGRDNRSSSYKSFSTKKEH